VRLRALGEIGSLLRRASFLWPVVTLREAAPRLQLLGVSGQLTLGEIRSGHHASSEINHDGQGFLTRLDHRVGALLLNR
jgi:hypothetical protein